MSLDFIVNGSPRTVPDDGASLLEVLRDRLGIRSAKDGCSPQGQCGCCTVLVDGSPRVACVTPARRIAGRHITTIEGIEAGRRDAWADAFAAHGASQCGFCTPGIIMRLQALETPTPGAIEKALLAHLCRCTGWQTIVEAAADAASAADAPRAARDLAAAARRAAIEGGTPQAVGPAVTLGAGGFADDTAPADALFAVPDAAGGWAVGDTLRDARSAANKTQGRRSTLPITHPIEVPAGDWDVTLRTTWVEPAYLEPDASWCAPGGEPATPLANGGAFGAKTDSIAPRAARALADEHGRAVRVVLSREDVVRLGPKRPPLAAGVRADGSGVVRVARAAGIADAIRAAAPGVVVEEIDVAGPPVSAAARAAGWAEGAVVLAAATGSDEIITPDGARASAAIDGDSVTVRVACGDVLDHVVLRSYCIGAAHMALGWVRSEGIAVDGAGVPHDLTIRSFGILRAVDMPHIDVEIEDAHGPPVNGSDAVFAAVALAAWRVDGLECTWPTRRGRMTP